MLTPLLLAVLQLSGLGEAASSGDFPVDWLLHTGFCCSIVLFQIINPTFT